MKQAAEQKKAPTATEWHGNNRCRKKQEKCTCNNICSMMTFFSSDAQRAVNSRRFTADAWLGSAEWSQFGGECAKRKKINVDRIHDYSPFPAETARAKQQRCMQMKHNGYYKMNIVQPHVHRHRDGWNIIQLHKVGKLQNIFHCSRASPACCSLQQNALEKEVNQK